jgi:hypothetical protein
MTTSPHAPGLALTIACPHAGRHAGNVAAQEMKLTPREAACRKDRTIA